MENNKADYTNTFCYLMNIKLIIMKFIKIKILLIGQEIWHNRLDNNNSKEKSLEIMNDLIQL